MDSVDAAKREKQEYSMLAKILFKQIDVILEKRAILNSDK